MDDATNQSEPLPRNPLRRWVAAAWAYGDRWARSLVSQIRPRVSLLTGSVLVLLTLWLPVAYEACGPNRTGYEVVRGKGIWPGLFTALLVASSGRVLYVLCLALAVLTLILVLFSVGRANLLRVQRWVRGLQALSAGLSLFVIVDLFWVFLGLQVGEYLEKLLNDDEVVALTAGITIVALAYCFRSRFLRGQRWVVWLFSIAGLSAWVLITNFFAALIHPSFLKKSVMLPMVAAPSILYWLVPIVLWYGFGLSPRPERQDQWLRIRPHIIQMYVPLVVIDCLFFIPLVRDGVWGYVVFFAGVHLIALGYMKLARKANQPLASEPVNCLSG